MAVVLPEPLRVIVIGDAETGSAVGQLNRLGDAAATVVAGVYGDYTDDEVLRAIDTDADLAIVCGNPKFDRIVATLRHLMLRKIPIVCDSGEMTWPWLKTPHLADVMNNEAQRAEVPVVGIGQDPAAVQMILPRLKAVSGVTRISVRRRVIGSARQIGLNRTAEQFRKLATAGLLGLSGLGELVVLVAQALGHHPMRADVRTALKPTLNDQNRVIGLHQTSSWSNDAVEIRVAYVVDGAEQARNEPDELEIVSQTTEMVALPANDLTATLAAVAGRLRALRPGLFTPLDIFNT